MIFAKLDVCYWRHRKFTKAGPAAAGYWAAALAWLREDDTEDGVLPFENVGAPLHVGAALGRKFAEQLVAVGLFARREGGYELLGYAEKNETRAQIAARRASTRERVDAFRKRKAVESNTGTYDTSNGVTSSVTHQRENAFVPGSGSDSGSDSDSDLKITDPDQTREGSGPPAHIEPDDPPPPVRVWPEKPVVQIRKLTAKGREIADGIALASGPFDVDASWLAFQTSGKPQTPGEWQAWCVRSSKFAKVDRDRDAKVEERRKAAYTAKATEGYSAPDSSFRPPKMNGDERTAPPAMIGELLASFEKREPSKPEAKQEARSPVAKAPLPELRQPKTLEELEAEKARQLRELEALMAEDNPKGAARG